MTPSVLILREANATHNNITTLGFSRQTQLLAKLSGQKLPVDTDVHESTRY